MCANNELFAEFSRHHVSYKDALEPNGPLKEKMVESLRIQMKEDPWRWQREMEAEFAEDEEAFFPLSLITRCISYDMKTYDESIALTGQCHPRETTTLDATSARNRITQQPRPSKRKKARLR